MENSLVECPHCHRSFKQKGIATHKKSCAEKAAAAEDEARYVADKRAQREGRWATQVDVSVIDELFATAGPEPLPVPNFPTPWETNVRTSNAPSPPMDVDPQPHDLVSFCLVGSFVPTDVDQSPPITAVAVDGTNIDPGNVGNRTHEDGDIRIEYHPSSGREPEVFAFEEFTQAVNENAYPMDPEPWAPFKTREDFEFAELARETGMTKAQIDALIRLFHQCIKNGKDSFTLSGYNEMRETLKVASE